MSTRKERYRFRISRGTSIAWQRKKTRLVARFNARACRAASATVQPVGRTQIKTSIAKPLGQVMDQKAASFCLQARAIGGHSAFSRVCIETESNTLADWSSRLAARRGHRVPGRSGTCLTPTNSSKGLSQEPSAEASQWREIVSNTRYIIQLWRRSAPRTGSLQLSCGS